MGPGPTALLKRWQTLIIFPRTPREQGGNPSVPGLSARRGHAHHLYPLGAVAETGQYLIRTAPCGPPSRCLPGSETQGCVSP